MLSFGINNIAILNINGVIIVYLKSAKIKPYIYLKNPDLNKRVHLGKIIGKIIFFFLLIIKINKKHKTKKS